MVTRALQAVRGSKRGTSGPSGEPVPRQPGPCPPRPRTSCLGPSGGAQRPLQASAWGRRGLVPEPIGK